MPPHNILNISSRCFNSIHSFPCTPCTSYVYLPTYLGTLARLSIPLPSADMEDNALPFSRLFSLRHDDSPCQPPLAPWQPGWALPSPLLVVVVAV